MDVKNQLEELSTSELQKLLHEQPSLMDKLDKKDLFKVFQKINPYCQVLSEDNKPVLFSITNWKEEYIKKQKTLTIMKFFDRMIYEYDDLATNKLGIQEDKKEEYKKVIQQFFDYIVKYDPNHCVRSSYQEKVEKDTQREQVSEDKKKKMPSMDFFERLQRYEESNMSEIKKDLKDFYSVRPDLQFALQIYGVFDNDKQANEFKDKNGPGLSVDIHKAVTNKWILLENNEQSLDKTSFYDKDNEILENMINQTKKDAEIGQQMLEMRQKQIKDLGNQIDKNEFCEYLDNMAPDEVRQYKHKLFDIDNKNSVGQFQQKK